MNFDTFSMPLSTPLYTMNAVTAIDSRPNTTGDTGDVINDVK